MLARGHLLILFAVVAGHEGLEEPDERSCSAGDLRGMNLPFPSRSAQVRAVESMHVIRTTTPHPFWMALPTEQSTPGYLSNSARDTRIMNPSGSVLVHEVLGRNDVCSRRHPVTGLPPLVVDVGAHVGWFTMLAASYGCRVIAFEPQPHAHPFLNASITLNGWQGRVRTIWGAVSSGDAGSKPAARMKMVNRHGWDNWDVTELVSLDDPDDGDEVPVFSLDQVVDEDVALLKIDAEGHEDFVIRSATSLLNTHKVDAILVETKGGGGEERDRFKREWFGNLTDREGYTAYEFYEEVGRSVFSWNLAEHLFPIQHARPWSGWPGNQVFEDHILTKTHLRLPPPGSVEVQWPPPTEHWHVYTDAGKVAIVIATYNFSIPTQGMLQIDLNGNMISQMNSSSSGAGEGEGLVGRYTLFLPELPDGSYLLDALLFNQRGERVEHEHSTYTTSFIVDRNHKPASTAAMTWHCQRFLPHHMCE